MKSIVPAISATALTLIFVTTGFSQEPQENPFKDIQWQEGPCMGVMGSQAEIKIPADYLFADGADTKRLMEIMHNPTSGEEIGFIAPKSFGWFVVFEYDDSGYIRDDEKNNLDADAMLQSIRKSTEASNQERKRRGWSAMNIVGWEQPPRYNESTHNLEWAIRGESEGNPIINWNTRLLGRSGVMRVTLVTDPGALAHVLPLFNERLAEFSYQSGHRYAEYHQGDKLAKYGLSALVVGGATAVAVQTGLFKWLWKILVVGGVAIAAWFKKLFSGRK